MSVADPFLFTFGRVAIGYLPAFMVGMLTVSYSAPTSPFRPVLHQAPAPMEPESKESPTLEATRTQTAAIHQLRPQARRVRRLHLLEPVAEAEQRASA